MFCLTKEFTDISSSKPNESVDTVGVSSLGNFDHSYSFSNVINILCLNVCGLKSKLNSSEFIDECKDFCFIILQEIKTDNLDEANIKQCLHRYEYDVVFKHNKKLSKHRSGGVGGNFQNREEKRNILQVLKF